MKILFLIILFVINTEVLPDTLADKEAAKKLTESVMRKVNDSKLKEGIDLLRPYMIVNESKYNRLKNEMAIQVPLIPQSYGETRGYELVKREEIGASLMLIVYIQKYERHIVRWQFYFYKPKGGWVINALKTDDDIINMFNDNTRHTGSATYGVREQLNQIF